MKNGTKLAVFTMGLPGSGKSTVLGRMHPGLAVIDPDLFKMSHPDYDPKNPGLVHDWSLEETEAAFQQALLGGADFAVDGTGTNAELMIRRMEQASAAGFFVKLVYVKVPLIVALARNAARERVVPEEIVRAKALNIHVSFGLVSVYANEVVTVDNA